MMIHYGMAREYGMAFNATSTLLGFDILEPEVILCGVPTWSVEAYA